MSQNNINFLTGGCGVTRFGYHQITGSDRPRVAYTASRDGLQAIQSPASLLLPTTVLHWFWL
jgi:hypothetical protein